MIPSRTHALLLCALPAALWMQPSLADDKPLCIGQMDDSARAAAAATPAPLTPEELSREPIEVSSDDAQLGLDGSATLSGNVVVRQGDREIIADRMELDAEDSSLRVDGNVEFRDPQLRVRGQGGNYSASQGANFRGAEFEMPARPARGTASEMDLTAQGLMKLSGVTFTTCPIEDTAWQLRARSIEIDTNTRNGVGRDARVEFKGVPILYTPWISFPVGTQRKSGFLFPGAGYSSRSGAQVSAPYYWNIAPNYDLTFEPVWYSRRGVDLAGEFRFLTKRSEGQLDASWLPDDTLYGDSRSYVRLRDRTELPAGWRVNLDAANVSDSQYFEDFAQGPEGTSVVYLPRLAEITYRDLHWRVRGAIQQFQTIDTTIPDPDRPYAMLPQLFASADFSLDSALPLAYGFDAELVNFDRREGVTGWRYDVTPRMAIDWEGAGYFVKPAVSWRATGYSLEDEPAGTDATPSRTLPSASLDAGLIFEGPQGSRGQRRVTLEPRALYTYTPYRNQDELPVFDTGIPDLNLVQLFRTNRYVGADRVSDANQLAVGVTSRLFDAASGRQLIAATIGQAIYFESPRVRLPDESPTDRDTSDLIAQLTLTAWQNWNVDFGLQWNPDDSERERMQVQLQYRPTSEAVVNLGYRYQRDRIDQADASIAWPIADRWSLYGRYVYSLQDDQTLDEFAGFEYRACCWKVRTLARRFVSSRTGERDTGIFLQLELTGLASVGSQALSFLQGAIRGYSPANSTP